MLKQTKQTNIKPYNAKAKEETRRNINSIRIQMYNVECTRWMNQHQQQQRMKGMNQLVFLSLFRHEFEFMHVCA